MKKILLIVFSILLSACSINNDVNKNQIISKKTNIWSTVNTWFQKYMKIVNSYNLTWCIEFAWKQQEECKLEILSSLSKLKNIDDCKIFSYDWILSQCKKIVYETNYMCNKLYSLQDKKRCFDDKYYKKALSTRNIYWCSYIINIDQNKLCKKTLKKIKDDMTKQSQNENTNCSIWLPSNMICKKDDNLCKINQLQSKFSITPSLIKKKKICDTIFKLNFTKWTYCYNQYYMEKSLKNLDPNICNNIKDKNIKDQCIQSSVFQKAVEMTKLPLCKKIIDIKKQEECIDKIYMRIITRDNIKDKTICNNIKDWFYKTKCYDLIMWNL